MAGSLALYFPNDLACVIHNADARLLDRNVQSSKMVHAAHDWLKFKNPEAPAVKREAEEDWGR
jgi:hypothetical protein